MDKLARRSFLSAIGLSSLATLLARKAGAAPQLPVDVQPTVFADKLAPLGPVKETAFGWGPEYVASPLDAERFNEALADRSRWDELCEYELGRDPLARATGELVFRGTDIACQHVSMDAFATADGSVTWRPIGPHVGRIYWVMANGTVGVRLGVERHPWDDETVYRLGRGLAAF